VQTTIEFEGMEDAMITTLTLNPAFDVHAVISAFLAGHENLAESVTRSIGGKGINISRALCENKISNTPVVVIGRENAAEFLHGLEEAGLTCKTIICDGRIRENITVHPADGPETRLSFKGFCCDASILTQAEQLIEPGGIVTFTGSLPVGISVGEMEEFLLRLKAGGSRLVIDSKSVTLPMLRRIKPWLIKPNTQEMEAYFGVMNEEEIRKAAIGLHRDGIQHVMISLGEEGAILAAEGALYRARVPRIEVRSTIGAGDSAIAGFIACDATPPERLRQAVAYGSAACLREGTNPPLYEDIQDLYHKVTVENIVDKK